MRSCEVAIIWPDIISASTERCQLKYFLITTFVTYNGPPKSSRSACRMYGMRWKVYQLMLQRPTKKGHLQQAPPKNISKIWKDFPILSQQGILKKESFYLIYRNLPWKRWIFLIHPCSSTKSFRELLSIILWWPNCSNFWERFAVPVPRSHRAPECQFLPGFMILGKLRVANGHGAIFVFVWFP